MENYGGFSNSATDTTTYYSSLNDTLPFQLFVAGITSCNDTIFDTLDVIINLPINISILEGNSLTICSGISATLNGIGSSNFLWSTGEITNSISVNSQADYYLTDTSNQCNNDTAFIRVNITPMDFDMNTKIIIPNVFTPNNDDENDILKVVGTNISSLSGKIFNRWGQLVYEWNDHESGWDGKDAPSGTYFYIIEVSFFSEDSQKLKGTLSLLK